MCEQWICFWIAIHVSIKSLKSFCIIIHHYVVYFHVHVFGWKSIENLLLYLFLTIGKRSFSFSGPFTVFGPTDKAFGKLPKPFVDFLLKNITVLGDILKYHVASGNVSSADLKNDLLVPSVLGSSIRINIYKNNKVRDSSYIHEIFLCPYFKRCTFFS